jgi:hypothetical protein
MICFSYVLTHCFHTMRLPEGRMGWPSGVMLSHSAIIRCFQTLNLRARDSEKLKIRSQRMSWGENLEHGTVLLWRTSI